MADLITPATEMPNLDTLRYELQHIDLLDYMMYCVRVDIGCCLPIPPPPISPRSSYEDLLEKLSTTYMRMMCRLNDSLTTEREIQMVEAFAPLIYLSKWLPRIKRTDIAKMTYPKKIDHLDYVYLLRDCKGYDSDLKDFLFFTKGEDYFKFQSHMNKKYPSRSSIRRNQIL